MLRRVLSGLSISITSEADVVNNDGTRDPSPPKVKPTISAELGKQPQPSVAAGGSSSFIIPSSSTSSHQMFADRERIECYHQTSKSWLEGVISGYHEDDGTYNLEFDLSSFYVATTDQPEVLEETATSSSAVRLDKRFFYRIPISRIRKITYQEGDR